MADYIRTYWPIFVTLAGLAASLLMHVTLTNSRLTDLETENDRQDTSIVLVQGQTTLLANDVTGMKADIRSIAETVNYIRNRIDRVTQ